MYFIRQRYAGYYSYLGKKDNQSLNWFSDEANGSLYSDLNNAFDMAWLAYQLGSKLKPIEVIEHDSRIVILVINDTLKKPTYTELDALHHLRMIEKPVKLTHKLTQNLCEAAKWQWCTAIKECLRYPDRRYSVLHYSLWPED
jgi:hypothetical protein